MPFAPMCLWEDADQYFHLSDGEKRACEFMTYAVDCREKMIRDCPAAVHVDGTARPQLLRREVNPRMHAILRRFKELSGVSCVINTSFNMHEEPIVCSPADAVRSFLESKLDVLVLESRLVVSRERFSWL
jgi:carbamoyltransferase